MDDGPGLWTGVPEGVDVSHDIVAQTVFVAQGGVVVNIVQMETHLVQLLLCDGDSQLRLTFRQSQPEPTPGTEFFIVGKQFPHLRPGVPDAKRAFVNIMNIMNIVNIVRTHI